MVDAEVSGRIAGEEPVAAAAAEQGRAVEARHEVMKARAAMHGMKA
jgi:hypothetical protein